MRPGSSRSGGQPAVPFQPEWQRQIEEWRELLAQCARKPSRKRIHALRTFTSRLPVVLEYWLSEKVQDANAVTALKCWKKEGKKLRRKLQPVRDADVYLSKLENLRGIYAEGPDGEPKLSPRCLREMEKLEKRLKNQRQRGKDKLMTFIGTHGKRLKRSSEEMQMALAPCMPSKVDSTAQPALRIFALLTRDFPELSSTNLHTFRKRLKPALYLAESTAMADPLARRLAVAFEKICLSIGDWHDWETLALKAKLTLPGCAKQDGLVAVMKKLANDALQRALGICRRSAARLLKNGVSGGSRGL